MTLEVKGFLETSFIDWDGKIVSVVYLPMCNFRCPFCHNSGLVEKPGQYDSISEEKIMTFLVEHKDFIDGVCLTGGEPLLSKDRGLFNFIKKVKKLGLKIKLDTNGSDPETLKRLIDQALPAARQGLVDYIAMDYKGPLDQRHEKLAGVKADLEKIKQSIRLIMSAGVPYEFRTTVVPTLLAEQDVEDMAKFIAGAEKFVLQQFVPTNCWSETLREVKPYPKEKLDEMLKLAKKYVENSILRGV